MGEVINIFTRRPMGQDPASSAEPSNELVEQRLDEEKLIQLLHFLTELRRSNPASYRRRNVELRRPTDARDEELFVWIQNSNEADWREHLSFYDAIIAELRRRNLLRNSVR